MTSEPTGAPLQLYDALTRSTTPFSPLEAGVARVYSCGPTVYSRAHLGNLRPYVFADTLRRALEWKGYEVRHIINITDVGHLLADADFGDDKVEVAAAREQSTVWDLTARYTELFKRDFAAVGCRPPERWTVATDYIPQMLAFATELERRGHAYRLPTGLYFDTSTIDRYGAMASVSHQGLIEGGRVEVVEGKRNPTDFALWRSFPADAPEHAMEWDSPWGRGAPGWHLECSVMSIDALGPHFDIHTGGVDHREVHHPNEDAQSRAYLADGEPWVGRWMHNEFLVLPKPAGSGDDEGEKISKSKGHVVSLDMVTRMGVDPLAFRLFLLASHYRSQAKLSEDEIRSVGTRFTRLIDTVGRRLPDHVTDDADRPVVTAADAFAGMTSDRGRDHLHAMDAAISDDLATPGILATLDTALRDDQLDDRSLTLVVECARALLGLDLLSLAARSPAAPAVDAGQHALIEDLIAQRNAARAAKDFALADEIRDRMRAELSVSLTDGPDGTSWTITSSLPSVHTRFSRSQRSGNRFDSQGSRG